MWPRRRSRTSSAPDVAIGSWREHLAGIRPDADPAEAQWWDTEWPNGSTPPAVGFLIPRGFEAYARVLHPALDDDGQGVTWTRVADECGTTVHPEAQWWRVAGHRDLDPRGRGSEPRRWPAQREPRTGCLERARFEALADVLGRHTTEPRRTLVAFWVGYGLWPASWHQLPPTRAGWDQWHLFERPLDAVATLCAEAPAAAWAVDSDSRHVTTFGGSRPTADELLMSFGAGHWQSPSAWWPADQSWATSSNTDIDSTLVGGSRALVDELLADDRLEALAWPTHGSLWSDADTINQ